MSIGKRKPPSCAKRRISQKRFARGKNVKWFVDSKWILKTPQMGFENPFQMGFLRGEIQGVGSCLYPGEDVLRGLAADAVETERVIAADQDVEDHP